MFGDQRGLSQDKPVEIAVLAGEEVTLPCEVKSSPPPIITWAKENQLISPFSPREETGGERNPRKHHLSRQRVEPIQVVKDFKK